MRSFQGRPRGVAFAALALGLLGFAATGRAQHGTPTLEHSPERAQPPLPPTTEPSGTEEDDSPERVAAQRALPATRNELAGLPAIAGNNVFGLLFGVTGSFTRFVPEYEPFRFRAQLTAVASLRGTDSGVRSPLQNIDLRLDFPGAFSPRMRLYVLLRYQRIENVGYWGIGNGAGDLIPEDYEGPRDRYFTWKKQMAQANGFARYKLVAALDLVVGLGGRVIVPALWADTKLARDVRTPGAERELLYGYTRQLIGDVLVGPALG